MKFHADTIGLFAILMAATAVAQTNVTNSKNGTTNTVPVYTGSATLGNSPISVSGANVGIGTTSPGAPLEVNGNAKVDGTLDLSGTGIINANAPTGQINLYSFGAQAASFRNNAITFMAPITATLNITASNYALLGLYPTLQQTIGAGNIQPMIDLRPTYSGFTNSGTLVGLNINLGSSPGTAYAALFNGGNVGIGTIAPAALFDVTGNIGSGANISYFHMTDSNSVLHTVAVGANTSRAAIGTTTNNDFAIFTNNGTDNLRIQASTGNVGIGTTTPSARLEVDGNVKLTANSGAAITFQDGTTQSTAYTGVVCGGDYAESVDVTGNRTKYEPGDVLVIDPDTPGKFLKSAERYSTAVTGIYSTKPGTVGRRQTTPKSPDEVPMAMIGIVPTKVSAENGPIRPGDLLVTSSTLGYAMKGTDRGRMLGAVIGKALGHLDKGAGVIEVVVTLQ